MTLLLTTERQLQMLFVTSQRGSVLVFAQSARKTEQHVLIFRASTDLAVEGILHNMGPLKLFT